MHANFASLKQSPWRSFLRILAAVFGLIGAAQSEEAGKVIQAIGDVRLGGAPARAGDVVQAGDQLTTGGDGYLYIKTVDQGFIILRPHSSASVLTYHVDAMQPANTRIKIELQRGVARSISGDAVKNARENFRFNTPVAAIGVRGTDFTVFTDDQTTRVAVVSGGVVVSGFGAGCGPEGAGPCEGSAKRELFAGQGGQVLQVNRGQAVPQLLRGSALSPDAGAPPRSDEPARTGAATTGAMAGASVANGLTDTSFAPIKLAGLDKPAAVPAAAPEAVPFGSAIVWGRWQALVDQPANIDLAKLQADYRRIGMDSYFALLRNKDTLWQPPTEGSISFALQGAQAIVQTGAGGPVSAAGIENGKLTVNFGASSFATRFDLVTQGQRIARNAEGVVFKDGSFGNANQFLGNNNMLVQGVLANDPGPRAAYLFQSRLDDNRVANGVTAWAK